MEPKGLPTTTIYPRAYFYAIAIPIYLSLGLMLSRKLVANLDDEANIRAAFHAIGNLQKASIGISLLFLTQVGVQMVASDSRNLSKVDLPDQYVYVDPKNQAILMATNGLAGQFNRAQRGVANWQETLPLVALTYFFLVALVPTTANFLVACLAIGRILFSLGYTYSNNGRLPGFILHFFSYFMLNGLVIVLAFREFGIEPPAIMNPFEFL